jgi:ribosomal protein S18 acetylase RimI-like enzyme
MPPEIREESFTALADYATIPIAFEVREVLAVLTPNGGLDGIQLVAKEVAVPYEKDYDAIPANHPSEWASRFDLGRWGVLSAWKGGTRVGGAVIAWGATEAELLEGQHDLAVLWDIRVTPAARGQGLGTALFQAGARWAVKRGAHWLKAETQNINVPACRFYAGQGCTLGALHRFAYASLPEEVQLLWYKQLA